MIAFLDGTVRELREGGLVVQAGALGIEAFAPAATLARLEVGDRVSLHTHLVVREDGLSLYAFHHADQLLVFRRLLEVGGVGPKVALAVLSSLQPAAVAAAIVERRPELLTAAPGIGKRTAERIVLELKDRIPDALLGGPGAPVRSADILGRAGEDAVAALLALGYRESQVSGTVAELLAAKPDETAESLIRKALGRLR